MCMYYVMSGVLTQIWGTASAADVTCPAAVAQVVASTRETRSPGWGLSIYTVQLCAWPALRHAPS
jgi:hypothetical protein